MPPPQQLLSPAVISKWLNPTFLILLVFLIVALPLSTPSSGSTTTTTSTTNTNTTQQQSPSKTTHYNQSFSSSFSSESKSRKQWPHWSGKLGEICPSAKEWTTHPGSFCMTLWNSPYLSNRTELEAREGRAIKHFCEMDRILERFDCAQEYSVNVLRGQCKLCRDAYREWACAMVTDTLDDGQLDCETKLMPCPSCASICHQVMRLCPYLTPDRNQVGQDGKLSPQVSQYGGHPAFYCPLENDDPSDPAYTSLCFHQSPFSSDPDYVHNICTNPPIHHHHNPYEEYEERKHYFSSHHRTTSRTNNDNRRRSRYFSQSSTDKRFSSGGGESSSASSTTNSNPEVNPGSKSNKGRREDYSNEKINNNNNNYYDSDSNTNTNRHSSANDNKFDYGEESFVPYDDHEDGGEDNWSDFVPHYTSCCWTYASSVVTFSNTQAYPEYGSDSYFSSVEPTTSSSSITTLLTNSGSGGSSSSSRTAGTSTTHLNRKPSSVSDNRVILNCCDSRGKCTSNDPFEIDYDDGSFSSSSEAEAVVPPSVLHPADSEIPNPTLQSPLLHPKLKTSRKRSSENIGSSSPNHNNPPNINEDPLFVTSDNANPPRDDDNLNHEKQQQLLHPVVRFVVKDVPKEAGVVLPGSKSDLDHEGREEAIRQDLHDSLPKPTHIPPGLDYDEHYMDTEPDGDGGSSSTELEDEDVFDPDWPEKTQTHSASRHSDRDYSTWSRDTTFSSSHSSKPEESPSRPNRNHEANSNNLLKSTTSSSTTNKNNLRNQYKHNNNKNNNLKESSSLSSSSSQRNVISAGGDVIGSGGSIKSSSSSSSSSVHYQKNAFMAIVIGGDDVDRRHLNLRTATDIIGGDVGGRSRARDLVTDKEFDEFQVNDFESKFSSDIHFNSLDFSNDYENEPENNNNINNDDEVYFRRTRGNLLDSAETHNQQRQSQIQDEDFLTDGTVAGATSSSAPSARLSSSSSIIGIASSTLTKLKGSLFLMFFSSSITTKTTTIDLSTSFKSSLESSRTSQAPQSHLKYDRKSKEEGESSSFKTKTIMTLNFFNNNSVSISYFLFTFFLLLILLRTTNNFLPIPNLSTDQDGDLLHHPSEEVLDTTTSTTITRSQAITRRKRKTLSVTLNIIRSWTCSTLTTPNNKSKSVILNVGESGLRNEKDEQIDKAASAATAANTTSSSSSADAVAKVMNAEDNQDYYKNYYDDIRNSRTNNLVDEASANYNYNCTDTTSTYNCSRRNLCKCKYDLYDAPSAFSRRRRRRRGIYYYETTNKSVKLFENLVKRKAVHLEPRLAPLETAPSQRDDNSCSHQLALLYYKVIKFLLILNSRSSHHDDTITILSVQHNNNYNNHKKKNNSSVIILGYFLTTITCLVADHLLRDLLCWSPWRKRRTRRRIRVLVEEASSHYYITFKKKQERWVIMIRIMITIIPPRLDYYNYLSEEDSNDNTGIKLCCSSRSSTSYNYYLVMIILSTTTLVELDSLGGISMMIITTYIIIMIILITIILILSIPSGDEEGGGLLANYSGHSGDSHSRFKHNDKSTLTTDDSLEIIKLKLDLRSSSRLSDSWVTTTIAYYFFHLYFCSSSCCCCCCCKRRRWWWNGYYYYDYDYYYEEEYSNRISSRVTIINKIIQFVVQYNLVDGSGGLREKSPRRRKKCLGQFKIFKVFKTLKMYSHCSRNVRSEEEDNEIKKADVRLEEEEKADEFPTKSYSKFLAFWLINLKISVINYDTNQDYDYYWYNNDDDDESRRWLGKKKPPCPYKLLQLLLLLLLQVFPINPVFLILMSYRAGCQHYCQQKFIKCQQCQIKLVCQHVRNNYKILNSQILTICQGCLQRFKLFSKLSKLLLLKLKLLLLTTTTTPAFFCCSKLQKDYNNYLLLLLQLKTYAGFCYNYYNKSRNFFTLIRLPAAKPDYSTTKEDGDFNRQSICFPVLNVNCSILRTLLRRIDNNYENSIIIVPRLRVCCCCCINYCRGSLLMSGSESPSSRTGCNQCSCSCNSWTLKLMNLTFFNKSSNSCETVTTKITTIKNCILKALTKRRALVESVQCKCFLILNKLSYLSFLIIFNILNILNHLVLHQGEVFQTSKKFQQLFLSSST